MIRCHSVSCTRRLAVADDLAFQVAGARCSQNEVGDSGAALVGAGFWGLADVAGEDDNVLHFWSPLLRGGTIPSDETRPRPSGATCIAAFGGGLTLRVRVERAAALSAQHGRKPQGMRDGNRTDLGDQSVGGIGSSVNPMET